MQGLPEDCPNHVDEQLEEYRPHHSVEREHRLVGARQHRKCERNCNPEPRPGLFNGTHDSLEDRQRLDHPEKVKGIKADETRFEEGGRACRKFGLIGKSKDESRQHEERSTARAAEGLPISPKNRWLWSKTMESAAAPRMPSTVTYVRTPLISHCSMACHDVQRQPSGAAIFGWPMSPPKWWVSPSEQVVYHPALGSGEIRMPAASTLDSTLIAHQYSIDDVSGPIRLAVVVRA